jgi:hypothetical protein
MVDLYIPRRYTRQERLAAQEAPGRKSGVVRGGYLHDLMSNGRAISLCPLCVGRFTPKSYHYEHFRAPEFGIFTMAKCDDCGARDPRCKTFIPEAIHDDVNSDRYRKGRWARRGGPLSAARRS